MPTTATNVTLSTSAQVCALSQVSTGSGNRKCRVRVWYSNLNTSGSNITMTVNVEWRWMTGTSGYYASGNKVTGYVQNSSGTQLCSASVAGFTNWPTSWSTYGSTSFTLSYPGTYSNTWKIQMGFESSTGYISGSGDIVQPTITAPTYRRVSFNANGHGTAPAAFWVAHNTVATAPTAPTASGYTFDGWYTNQACTTAYNWSSAVTADIVLYARWKSTRDLTFKSGSNGATSTTVTQNYYNDVAQAVSFPAPASYSGYSALGWRDDTTASAKEYGGASATNVTYTGTATTLYAVYSKSATVYSGISKATTGSGTIYYNSGNSWGHSAFTAITAITSWTNLGYRNDTTAGAKEYNVAAQTGLTADPGATFYAVYSRTITLKYAAGGGTGTMSDSTATQYYNTNGTRSPAGIMLAANQFTRAGYSFATWDLGTPGTRVTFTENTVEGTTKTATAEWNLNSYTITLEDEGNPSNESSDTDAIYTIYSSAVYLNSNHSNVMSTTANAITVPTITGLTFGGYYSGDNGTGTQYIAANGYITSDGIAAAKGYTSNQTWYAKWTRTLTFKSGLNGATSATATQNYYNSAFQAVSFPAPATISGYTVLGWRDDESAAAKEYGGTAATNVTYTGTATTLYAVYSKSATYYSGTNKASSGTGTVFYNSSNKWGHSAFTQTAIDGWTSLGFRNDTTADAKEYNAAAETALTADPGATFYAVYSKAATAYSGISKATTGSGTIYYNTNNSWGHSAFTAITAITTWTALGYRNDTTASTSEYTVAKQTGLTADPGTTFYAVYSRAIAIAYAAGGGSGSMSNTTGTQYYNTNDSISPTGLALAANGFTRAGHTFTGWNLGTVGTTITFGVSDTTVTKTATAQWSVNSYTITLEDESNPSNESSDTDAIYTVYNSNVYLDSAHTQAMTTSANGITIPTVTGVAFGGYYSGDNGTGTQYIAADGKITTAGINAAKGYTSNQTWYAKWSRTLTFKSGSNQATTNTITQSYYNGTFQSVSFPAPAAISGYTALGWRDDVSATIMEYGGASATNVTYTGTVTTLYAVYQDNTAATYYSGTNKASSGTGVIYYNSYNRWGHSAFTQSTISGWTSIGFRNDTTADVKEYNTTAETALTSDPGNTFYAVYSKAATAYSGLAKATTGSGTIYYNSNNSWGHSAFTAITAITSWVTLGYRNDTTASTSEYTAAKQIGLTADPGTTFYAVYSRTIVLTYAPNGGTGTMSNTAGVQYYNSNGTRTPTGLTLAANGFTRTGYTFTGWDLGAVGAMVTFDENTNAGLTKTATAQWSINSYTLIINPNGGTYNNSTYNSSVTQNYGTTYTLLRPTRPGYVFSHWTANVACDCTQTAPNIGVYNNSGGGTVTHSWITDSSAGTNMSVLQITTNGTASPGAGGFVQNITSQASHTYIHVIYAKIPTGYNIAFAANATGDNRIQRWLTPTAGTGSYRVYVSKLIAGATGTFSTFGHMYITGSNNTSVTWYVAASYVYDFTAGAFKSNIKGNYNFGSVASNVTLTAQWDKHRTARIVESGTAYSSIPRYPYVWNGSTFKQGWLYVWDGSKWVEGEWDKIK